MKQKKRGTYDILAAIAYEKRREKWSMKENQLYYQIKQKIHDIPIEFFRWLKYYISGQTSRKGKSEVLRELGKPIPQSSRRNGLT